MSDTELERSQQVQSALYRIAETASAAQDMPAFYAEIHQIVGELMYAENLYIALYDEERQAMNWPFVVDVADDDFPDPSVWEPIGTGDTLGLTALLLKQGTPMLITTAQWRDMVDRGEVDVVGSPSVSWLGAPLRDDDRTVGAIVVQSYREDIVHSEEDKELLTFVANHIGAALSRARAIEETRQRNAELALINDVQRGLAENLEMQAMYDLVGDRLQGIFDAQVVDIGMLDRETGLLDFPYAIERGVRYREEHQVAPIGFSGLVLETARTVHGQRRRRGAGSGDGEPRDRIGRDGQVRLVRAAGRGRRGHGPDLAAEPRPRARLHRRRCAPAHDPRGELERRARERPAVRGVAAAERRAGPDQHRAERSRREPRDPGDVRPGR